MRAALQTPSVIGPTVGFVRLPHAEGLPLPGYESAGAAGMDLRAAVPEDRPLLILPGKRALVPTGLILEIPEGIEGQVRPRSGLAFKHGLTVLNSPGTIDADYRGEIKVILINLSDTAFEIKDGERIAQLIVARHERVHWEEANELPESDRGAGGFGST